MRSDYREEDRGREKKPGAQQNLNQIFQIGPRRVLNTFAFYALVQVTWRAIITTTTTIVVPMAAIIVMIQKKVARVSANSMVEMMVENGRGAGRDEDDHCNGVENVF